MSAVLLFLCFVAAADADQLRFSSARQWSDWQLPLGAVEVAPNGSIQPVRVTKNTDAVRDALQLGGGIRWAGSNPRDAVALLDGNLATGWAPSPDDDPDDWFVEIDLGRSVSARGITLVFDDDAPPFELFDLLLSSGEPQLDQVANPIAGSLLYRIKERFKENARHRVTFAPGAALYLTPIRFLQIRNLKHVPDARLVAVEVESIGDNLTLNLIERGGAIDIVIDAFVRAEEVTLGNALNLVDGSIFNRWRNGREPRNTYNTWSHITIDLGAVYPVDFVRLITGIAIRGGFGEHLLRTRAGASGARSFSYKNYEVLTSDGSIAPDGTRIWTRHFAGYPDSENHRAGLADHQFPTLPARFVRIAWLIWDATCAATAPDASSRWGCYANGSAEEIQVYGDGYPLTARLRSPLIDLESGKNLNSLEWQAQTPLGTHIEIRSRTGNEVVEQYTFYDKNGREVTQRRYDKLIPSFKGKIDTTRIAGADWSPWSNIYSASGAAFQSPSPRRFMELDVRLASDSPTQAPHFNWLAVNFSDPLASKVVGEVFPLQVTPGQETQFSYFLRPATTRDGFDQIVIEATTVPRFDAALVDDEPVEVVADTLAQGFRATFPHRIRSRQLVELRFTAPIYLQATRFDAFLEDSQKAQRQLVDPGDAAPQVESSSNVVRLPVADQLFAGLSFSPALITPNGDGINDQLLVSFDLINVLTARPLRLRLYDLSGRPLFAQERDGQAGHIEWHWDGRDQDGQRVPPGLYIAELHIAGDAGDRSTRRIVAVAY
ncbi:MAG: gliding motility-associated C-terminal domain-containing protein [Candidatus Latescibacteria bacterium]|nr:gliding motility-associated C-terminal domain-containing protein [Candidatus Latescibacterota bacterium]